MSDMEMDYAPAEMHIETSAEIGDVFAALAKAQGEIKNATKDKANDHFRSKYATLDACYDACRGPLSKAGVAVVQTPFNEGGDIGVTTIIGVASGQWMRGRLKVQPTKYDAQAVGSVITYLRRYSLCAMVGVAPGDDDDGEAAVGRPQNRQQPQERATGAARGSGQASGQRPASDAPAQSGDGDKRKDAKAKYDALKKAIGDALDHADLDDIEKKAKDDGSLDLIEEVSRTSAEAIKKLIIERHDYISRGPDAPGDQP